MFAWRQEGKVGMEEDGKVVEEERKVVVEMGIRTKNSWTAGRESILEPGDVSSFVRQVTDVGVKKVR